MNSKGSKKKDVITRRRFITATAVTGISLSLSSLYSCKKSGTDPEPTPPQPGDTPLVSGFSIPAFTDVKHEGDLNITGQGFITGDKVVFTDSVSKKVFSIEIKSITAAHAVITIPKTLLDGKYSIAVQRGSKSTTLGSTTLSVVLNPDLPDKAGMTIKGVVHVAGTGLAGVIVSDGIQVTKTDQEGVYYLPSNKKTGFVFLSIPGNYEVASEGSKPVFFKTTTSSTSRVEIKDFVLTPANNNNHVMLALGDMHLANRNNDIKQFQDGFLADINQVIQSYKNNGTKVYALTLGDMTWDGYWYTNNYGLDEYRILMNKINTPVFHTMGNHDNDPYYANDIGAENKFRNVLGPTYYSFNIGKVHYVVLDNIEYTNTGGAQGTVGERNYNAKIVAEQLEWLKKDLAMIEDKSTPIVVSMHIQLNNNPQVNSSGNETSTLRLSNSAQLIAELGGFSIVHVLTGHTHINYAYENSDSLMEHNSGAVCATWWWTGRDGYAGNHLCKDGAPGGYVIWEAEDKNLKWQNKSIGYEKEYQFRAYDLNKVRITAADHAPKSSDAALAKYAAEYANVNANNEVLINVWGYDKKWKVEVFEGGNPLIVTRVYALDPLHIISYSALRLNAGAEPTEDFVTGKTGHLFKAKATSSASTLEIRVTDRFGRTYTESMVRPKAFTYKMR